MSLKHLADELRSKGRGNDTMLIHMSPREVGGLQALALAHGGSLSINPDTGLPEANFLEAILPTVAGIGLSVASGGTLSPLMIGAGLGGATALATGSIEKGLLAGLGGWGGAGIGAGLMGAGAAAGMSGAAGAAGAAEGLAGATAADVAAFGNLGMAPTAATNLSNFGAGLGQLASAPGATLANIGYAPVAAALAPAVFQQPDQADTNQDAGQYIRPYDYDYTTQQFTPLTPVPASDWGSRSFAEGGEVDDVTKKLQGYYDTYLGRSADPAGLEYWKQRAQEGTSLADIQRQIMGSPEYTTRQVAPQYTDILGRQPDQPGLEHWSGAMQAGETLGNIRQAMLNSPEFQQQLDAVQARQMAASPRPMAQDVSTLPPVQQAGAAMIPNRYAQPQAAASRDVQAYNRILANRAANEYLAMPQLEAMRPRSPQEMAQSKIRLQERAEATRANMANKGKPAEAPVAQPVTPTAQTEPFVDWYQQNWGGGGDGMAAGGIAHLGSYSDGGRLLKGPGDGVSDDIPATISDRQPARLADGEFVIPARIVSEIGNGSTDAGAKRLYAMMDRIQKAREKTVGKDRVAVDSKAHKELPA